MNAWIILLLLLAGNNGGCGCGCSRDDGMNRRSAGYGCNVEPERDGRDCDGSRFEPRFDARPFNDRETCGCEESGD